MRQYFYLLLLCFILYVKDTICMKRVVTTASLNLGLSNVTILHVKLVNSLQTVYVSMRDTDGYPKIKSYTLSGSSFIQQKIYAEPTHTVYPDNIMLFIYYTTPMVIGVQSTNLNFSVCYMGNATCMPNTYTVNQTVSGYLQSMTQGIVLYVGSLGTIYWVNASTFPTAGYKTAMLLGLIGTPAAVLSPNQNYAAVGVSGENKVYLLELVNKTLLYTFTLNAVDTRVITWSNNSARIFVVTPNQGIIYQLNITSPYTVKTYRYETASTVTAYNAQFLGYTDEVVIWTYKNNRSVIQMYSFHLFNYRNFHVEKYNTTANITGTSCDNATKEFYAEWTTNQVYIKKIEAFCNNEGGFYGDFYDQCQGKCVGCTNIFCGGFCNTYGCGSSCTTYTSLLPATLPISVYNMNTVPNVTVTNVTNTTVTNTTVVNTTVTNTTLTNTTVADTATNTTTNTTTNNTTTDLTLNTTATNTTIDTNVTANTTIVTNTTIDNTVTSNTTVVNSTGTNITANTTVTENVTANTTVGNATNNSTETLNTTLTTNSTATVNNTTNNTTVPQNITQNTNETNQNETNTTETNPTPLPIIIPPTPPDQTDPNQDSQELPGLYKNFQILLNNTLRSDVLQDLNSVPGGRRFLRPIFTFFGNLDDFWLYIYHPRNYEFVITSTFQSIQSLQNEKWTLLPYETLWSHVGIDLSHLKQTFSEKLPYTSEKFITTENNSSGFFINTANFLLSNMLITVAMFLVGRFLFYLLFNFKVSIFFRQYSFWPYLMMIIMDGNLQYASYLMAFELRWLVYFNFFYKLMAVWIIINFFIMVLFAIACYYIFRYIYGELAKYFFDNSQNSNQGAFYMMAQSGLRNILLGFVHYIDFQVYSHKITILVFLEVAFLAFGLKVIGISNIFEHKINAWINFIAGFLRILVISTFYFQQNITNQSDITYTSPLFVHLIGIYILIGLSSIIIELTKLVLGIFGFLKPKQFDKLNQQEEAHQIILKNNKRLKITVINPQKNLYKQKAKAIKIQTAHNKSFRYHDQSEEIQEISQSYDLKNSRQIDFDRKQNREMTYKSRIKKKFALENQKHKFKESNKTYFEIKESNVKTTGNQNKNGTGKAKFAKTMKINFKKTGIELKQF